MAETPSVAASLAYNTHSTDTAQRRGHRLHELRLGKKQQLRCSACTLVGWGHQINQRLISTSAIATALHILTLNFSILNALHLAAGTRVHGLHNAGGHSHRKMPLVHSHMGKTPSVSCLLHLLTACSCTFSLKEQLQRHVDHLRFP